jgi:ectoine hydroxylase-related dioxygenase (phytanoyl-CoA dioxygenase family)
VITVDCKSNDRWLELSLAALRFDGCALVLNVLDNHQIEETRAALYRTRERIELDIGADRLRAAGELGVLRLMLRYEPHFLRLLELPEVLAIVDGYVAETAVLHLQNGLILPPMPDGERADVFQTRFHRDFPRILNGSVLSVNTFFAVDEFTEDNGGTLVVPGTPQIDPPPSDDYLLERAERAVCPAGSLIVFDSTLLHAAGQNYSDRDRCAINQQFTRSYVKQQVDYVRALGDSFVEQQEPRTQQLLGWYTRVVTSLDEYYRPADQRLYRSGQG